MFFRREKKIGILYIELGKKLPKFFIMRTLKKNICLYIRNEQQ